MRCEIDTETPTFSDFTPLDYAGAYRDDRGMKIVGADTESRTQPTPDGSDARWDMLRHRSLHHHAGCTDHEHERGARDQMAPRIAARFGSDESLITSRWATTFTVCGRVNSCASWERFPFLFIDTKIKIMKKRVRAQRLVRSEGDGTGSTRAENSNRKKRRMLKNPKPCLDGDRL